MSREVFLPNASVISTVLAVQFAPSTAENASTPRKRQTKTPGYKVERNEGATEELGREGRKKKVRKEIRDKSKRRTKGKDSSRKVMTHGRHAGVAREKRERPCLNRVPFCLLAASGAKRINK